MRGAQRVDYRTIATRSRAPQRGLVVQGISETKPWSDAAIPVLRQAMGILPSRTEAGEDQRARTSVGAGIRQARIEIAEYVVSVARRQVDLIPQAQVHRQPRRHAPVVLKIHLVCTVLAGNIPYRIEAVA